MEFPLWYFVGSLLWMTLAGYVIGYVVGQDMGDRQGRETVWRSLSGRRRKHDAS